MDEQILRVVDAIAEWTGIRVKEYHFPMLEYELTRLTDNGDAVLGAERVLEGDNPARRKLICAISNSETYLFRHWGHFQALRQYAETRVAGGGAFNVLSAGCSSGEECWSAAAVVGGVYLSNGCDSFSVTGWDVDPERLRRARSGVYRSWATRKGLHGYDSFVEASEDRWRVANILRRFVRFAPVNLVGSEWPDCGRFDAILFRNVSIYWDRETTQRVRDRLADYLAHDGILLVGPSDPVEFDSRVWSVETGRGAPVVRRKPDAPVEQSAHTRSERRVRVKGVSTHTHSRMSRMSRPGRSAAAIRRETPTVKTASPQLSDIEDLANRGQYQAALDMLLGAGFALSPAQKLWEGILLLNLDRVQEAVRVFKHCVFLEPDDPSYRHWLAVALDAAGYKADAAREYRNARNIEVET